MEYPLRETSESVKVCRRCGCHLSRDHQDDERCTPCLRSNRGYDPRSDPLFLDKLLAVLTERAPERVEPLKAMGIHPEHRGAVKDAVRTLRRRGYVITAVERSAGYHYLGQAVCQRVDDIRGPRA